MSEFEKNLTATEKMIEAEKMLNDGAPLTVISKTLGIPLAAIQKIANGVIDTDEQRESKNRLAKLNRPYRKQNTCICYG